MVASYRYGPALRAVVPAPVVWAMFVSLWSALLAPAALVLGPPLLDRMRRRRGGP
jgi:hypothetical protein